MAAKISPRKGFNFQISFVGYPYEPFLVQKVNLPDKEIEVAEHSEGNHDVKTGGRIKVSNLTLENIMRTTNNQEALFFWEWMESVQSADLNGGLEPAAYYRTIIIKEVGTNGKTPINTWVYEEVFPVKANGLTLDRKSSDNTIESIELSVNTANKY